MESEHPREKSGEGGGQFTKTGGLGSGESGETHRERGHGLEPFEGEKDYFKNPLPQISERELDKFVEEKKRGGGGQPASRVMNVDPSTLYSSQRALIGEYLDKYLLDPKARANEGWPGGKLLREGAKPLIYVLPDGRKVVRDGNHRIVAAVLSGEKSIPVKAIRVHEPFRLR